MLIINTKKKKIYWQKTFAQHIGLLKKKNSILKPYNSLFLYMRTFIWPNE